ncbi:hypothetical protein GO013_07420 [Pseudodesulfovibrio sp. JC047]|uniref:hypothetical protein n=1 Tax=Pseudodesulfovibrio sp. JC047 TaxID=2683199 RepID=UPI0013D1707E|nr:hypothetical protein [Pseudodesulfovibrio sp. JC047]NDV19248.1 hypothetical protein [Pseudodesulfovibrio sp. JC047]
MSKPKTQQLIDWLKANQDKMTDKKSTEIVDCLEGQVVALNTLMDAFEYEHSARKEYSSRLGELEAEARRLRKVLSTIYGEDQHPNYDDPTSPIIGSLGKMAWKALNRTQNGG